MGRVFSYNAQMAFRSGCAGKGRTKIIFGPIRVARTVCILSKHSIGNYIDVLCTKLRQIPEWPRKKVTFRCGLQAKALKLPKDEAQTKGQFPDFQLRTKEGHHEANVRPQLGHTRNLQVFLGHSGS